MTKTSKNKKSQTNYPIGDFLIQIKNAALAKKRKVTVQKTKLIFSVAKSLKKEGYLSEIEENDNELSVTLGFHKKEPKLFRLKLISRPGLRVYMGADELEKRRGPETLIISTPKGIMTLKAALKKRLGGEVIAEII